MTIKYEKTVTMNKEEATAIRATAKVLDELNCILQDDEKIKNVKVFNTYYDKDFVRSVYDFMWNLGASDDLTAKVEE